MRALVTASALALVLAACGSQPPAPEQDPSGVESRTPSNISTSPVASVKPDSFDPTSIAALKDPRSPLSKRNVFFDYDSYVVKDEFQSLLLTAPLPRWWILFAKLAATASLSLVQAGAFVAVAWLLASACSCSRQCRPWGVMCCIRAFR